MTLRAKCESEEGEHGRGVQPGAKTLDMCVCCQPEAAAYIFIYDIYLNVQPLEDGRLTCMHVTAGS